jgi:rubrerythrin
MGTPDLRTLLSEALEDERKAEAAYAAVIDRFGPVRPFINIIDAEGRHSAAIERQMRRLGFEVPASVCGDACVAPPTLEAACEHAVAAELLNIALFDRLIPRIQDETVRRVFENLQAASRDRHLPAFRRCLARAARQGSGRGCRGNPVA